MKYFLIKNLSPIEPDWDIFGESSSAANISKEVKFVKAKESIIATTNAEKVKPEKKKNVTDQRFMTKPPKQSVVKPKGKGKSFPKSQRGLRTQHFYHHCGIQGHTRPSCHKLQTLKNSNAQRLLNNQEVDMVTLE